MIEIIKEFIIENKSLLAIIFTSICAITDLVLLVIQTFLYILSKQSYDVKEFILEKLPLYIKTAEDLLQNGDEKKAYVISCVREEIRNRFKNVIFSIYIPFIKTSIEKILSTPSKDYKEVKK